MSEKLSPQKTSRNYPSALFNLIGGILGIFLLLFVGYILIAKPHLYGTPPLDLVTEVLLGIYGIGLCIIGIGLWQLRRWAYWSEVTFSIVYILYSIFTFFQHPKFFNFSVSSSLFFRCSYLYFYKSKVKRAFQVPTFLKMPEMK